MDCHDDARAPTKGASRSDREQSVTSVVADFDWQSTLKSRAAASAKNFAAGASWRAREVVSIGSGSFGPAPPWLTPDTHHVLEL